jgi:alpha/beta superfamily hydrolase
MNKKTQKFELAGAVGRLECALDLPPLEPRGIGLVAHPHPLYGGTMDNKVAHSLARTFTGLGYAAVRMNFRGVGESEGVHDHGIGETDDMLLLLEEMQRQYPDLPVALSGFSFGTFVQSRLQQRLMLENRPAERLVLVGSAAGKWDMPTIPANSLVIHGELDDTITLAAVMEWLRPQDIPVLVIPGADHFFHRKLQHIRNYVTDMWHR